MWRCPNCETKNDGDKCVVCGKARYVYGSGGSSGAGGSSAVSGSGSKPRNTIKFKPPSGTASVGSSAGASSSSKLKTTIGGAGGSSSSRLKTTIVGAGGASVPSVMGGSSAPSGAGGYTPVPPIGHSAAYTKGDGGAGYKDTKEKSVHSGRSTFVLIALAACIAGVLCAMIVFLQFTYSRSVDNLDKGQYSMARKGFKNIRFYRDSRELYNKCNYEEATQLMNNGKTDDAKALFEKNRDYNNSKELINECDYLKAAALRTDGQYIEAYELYNNLGVYKESKSKALETKADVYDMGVMLYDQGNYEEAKTYFDTSADYADEEKYKLLISAHDNIGNISELYPLIGFADTNDLLLGKYIEQFMTGFWSDSYGDYLSYYNEFGENRTETNLPNTSMSYYKLEDGVHYHGDKYGRWFPQFGFEIQTEDRIRVYCYNNSRTYTLSRQ